MDETSVMREKCKTEITFENSTISFVYFRREQTWAVLG